jgi:serine/threonine-protein kinase HipA
MEVYSIETGEYHPRCSKLLFDIFTPPVLKYSLDEAKTLAGTSETIFLDIQKFGSERRLSFNSDGSFFLRIPADTETPCIETTTLDISEVIGVHTANHGLSRLASGELAFISRRFEKPESRAAEFPLISSMEEAGSLIIERSDAPGLDAIRFLERVIFCFITGCHDVNFSMFTQGELGTRLTPAYDLLPDNLSSTHQSEVFIFTLNGKRTGITKNDFLQLAQTININRRSAENVFASFSEKIFDALGYTDKGFLKKDTAQKYRDFIQDRASVISL